MKSKGERGRWAARLAVLPVILIAFALLAPAGLSAQKLKEMQFVNQPITDILLALGQFSGRSIVPDETVTGSASYYFAETDFETALQVFLQTYKMFHTRDGNIIYVSRVRADYDPTSQTVSLDADEVNLPLLVRAVSRAVGRTILFDPLPAQPLTVHVSRLSTEKVLEILLKRFPEFSLETDNDYFYIRRVPAARDAGQAAAAPGRGGWVQKKAGLYSLRLDRGRFQEVLDDLFQKAGCEYSLLARRDTVLENLRFEGKEFEPLLRLVLEQASADYTQVGGIYYIFEVQQRDVLKKLKTTIRLPLRTISSKDLINLFPAELMSGNLFKIDTVSNSIILSGSIEEIGPAQEFIRQIDQPLADRQYYRFDLSYLDPAKVAALLPPALKSFEPIVIPGTGSFIAPLSTETKTALTEYLKLVDRPKEATAVRLKYIKAEEFLKKLPPSITKEEVIETGDPKLLFVKTSEHKLADFYRELRLLDQPAPQIRYDFLVVQYQEGKTFNSSADFEASLNDGGTQTAFLGTMGKLLSLNFDIVSTFGYQFALQMNLDLSTNRARVLADTTLIGLSDQEISFQNTDTFRYREIEVDEDGNVKFTGVTREITAGLIFNLRGWVSGDEMVTMVTKAIVSKRGTDLSTGTGALPPTSENVISTQVRTPSGQPIIISGINRQEKSRQVSKIPLLGDIPLLGYLFRSQKDSVENTELVIYIVPRLEYREPPSDIGARLERLYRQFSWVLQP